MGSTKKLKQLEEEDQKLKEENSKLTKFIYTDELTKLENRKALVRMLFKNINEIYGIDAGNFVLRAYGSALKNYVKEYENWKVFRTNADEFIIVIDYQLEYDECEANAIKLSDYLQKCKDIYYDTLDTFIGVESSIGIAIDDKSVLEKADIALKSAKKGNIPYSFFLDEFWIETNEKEDLKWSKLVKKAVQEDQVVVYCQPIYNRPLSNI